MKSILVIGLALLGCINLMAQPASPRDAAFLANANYQAAGGETLWLSQTTTNDDWGNSEVNWSQFITNSSGADKTITKVVTWFYLELGAQYVTNSFRTAVNGGGNLVGSAEAVSVAYPGVQEVTWTWTSNYPVITNGTALYMTFRPQNGGGEAHLYTGTIAGGTYYENTVYATYRGATAISAGTTDIYFKIYTQ